jgi:hypothetical protein
MIETENKQISLGKLDEGSIFDILDQGGNVCKKNVLILPITPRSRTVESIES